MRIHPLETRISKVANPNPVGFGILAAVTLWPSLGLIAIGIWRTRLLNRREPH